MVTDCNRFKIFMLFSPILINVLIHLLSEIKISNFIKIFLRVHVYHMDACVQTDTCIRNRLNSSSCIRDYKLCLGQPMNLKIYSKISHKYTLKVRKFQGHDIITQELIADKLLRGRGRTFLVFFVKYCYLYNLEKQY